MRHSTKKSLDWADLSSWMAFFNIYEFFMKQC